MRRGVKGARTGRPDVPLPATQPVQTPTGLPYGEAGQLAQLQQQVPLARQGTPGGPGTPPGGPDFGQVLQAARGVTPPDRPLNAPTQRPNESITAGLPASVPVGPTTPNGSLSETLNDIATRSGSADLVLLARVAQSRGQ